MGGSELQTGAEGQAGFVQMFGFQESLRLDNRGRFRLPDDLAAALHRALARAQGKALSRPSRRPRPDHRSPDHERDTDAGPLS